MVHRVPLHRRPSSLKSRTMMTSGKCPSTRIRTVRNHHKTRPVFNRSPVLFLVILRMVHRVPLHRRPNSPKSRTMMTSGKCPSTRIRTFRNHCKTRPDFNRSPVLFLVILRIVHRVPLHRRPNPKWRTKITFGKCLSTRICTVRNHHKTRPVFNRSPVLFLVKLRMVHRVPLHRRPNSSKWRTMITLGKCLSIRIRTFRNHRKTMPVFNRSPVLFLVILRMAHRVPLHRRPNSPKWRTMITFGKCLSTRIRTFRNHCKTWPVFNRSPVLFLVILRIVYRVPLHRHPNSPKSRTMMTSGKYPSTTRIRTFRNHRNYHYHRLLRIFHSPYRLRLCLVMAPTTLSNIFRQRHNYRPP